MPEVHLPHLDETGEPDATAHVRPADVVASQPAPAKPHRRSVATIALEVLLISTGVFLGLAGEQWRESARHRELAEMSLQRFRSEVVANRKIVADVKEYHVTTQDRLSLYLAADPDKRRTMEVTISGIRPAFFERTAWDAALATQAVAYIDPNLIFSLSRIYETQRTYGELTHGMMQAMYLRPPDEDLGAFLRTLHVYYGDVVGIEPQLLAMYDEVIPQIDRALRK